jgi:sucrose-6-phosphate hydrolase SacC (GH32 family)
MVLPEASGATLEILATFRADGAESFGVQVTLGDGTGTVVGYRPAQGELYVQRGGNGSNLPTFATPQVAPLTPRAGVVQLQILLDYGSVEVFADGGRVTLTNQIFAGPHDTGLAVFAEGGAAVLEALVVYPLGVRG